MKTGKEIRKISRVENIYWYFYTTPEIISDAMMKKIESGTMWLVIEINHDNKTASYFFEENNHAHTSNEDDYYGVLEFFEEIEQESNS